MCRRVGTDRAGRPRAQVAGVVDRRARTRERPAPHMERLASERGHAGCDHVGIGGNTQSCRTRSTTDSRARIGGRLGVVEVGQVVECVVRRLGRVPLESDRVGFTARQTGDDRPIRDRVSFGIRRVVLIEVSGHPVRRARGVARRIGVGALLDRDRRLGLSGCIALCQRESE